MRFERGGRRLRDARGTLQGPIVVSVGPGWKDRSGENARLYFVRFGLARTLTGKASIMVVRAQAALHCGANKKEEETTSAWGVLQRTSRWQRAQDPSVQVDVVWGDRSSQ